jgi:hypothetical protein
MNRADIILETIYQYYSTLALEDSAPEDLAELIDNAVTEQVTSQVEKSFMSGYNQGYAAGSEI